MWFVSNANPFYRQDWSRKRGVRVVRWSGIMSYCNHGMGHTFNFRLDTNLNYRRKMIDEFRSPIDLAAYLTELGPRFHKYLLNRCILVFIVVV